MPVERYLSQFYLNLKSTIETCEQCVNMVKVSIKDTRMTTYNNNGFTS